MPVAGTVGTDVVQTHEWLDGLRPYGREMGREPGRRRWTLAGALVAVLTLLSGCTGTGDTSARRTPAAALSVTKTDGPTSSSSVQQLLRVIQLRGSLPGPDTVVPTAATASVSEDISLADTRYRSVVLAFAPLTTSGRCLLRAELVLGVRSGAYDGVVRLYPSAALSLASGRLPPASSGGPETLLDNQPSADGNNDTNGMQHFDVTDLLRLWADGGPFPSTGRSVPLHSPVVLTLRVPDFSNGKYTVTYSVRAPKPRLVISTKTACL